MKHHPTETIGSLRETLRAYTRVWSRHRIRMGCIPISPLWWMGLHSAMDYAQVFGIACVDVERDGSVGGEVPDTCTILIDTVSNALTCRFSHRHPERSKRGEKNPDFLHPHAWRDRMEPILQQLAVNPHMVLLHCPPVYPTETLSPSTFIDMMDHFLGGLPGTYRYALEIHNEEFLLPDYRACLRDHQVAHVVHSGGGVSLLDQVCGVDVFTAEAMVVRCIVDSPRPDVDSMLGVREAVRRCIDEKREMMLLVDDGGCGSAPLALAALLESLNPDLAKLSPIKREAA